MAPGGVRWGFWQGCCQSEKQTIADQLAGPEMAALLPADRARAQRPALTTLRHLARADTVLKPLLRKAPPDDIVTLLRLATVEMLVEGAPAHGVVNSAVALTRTGGRKTEAFAGMVNAVLRRVSETQAETFAALPPPPLAPWLRRRLIDAWGKQAVQAFEAVQVEQPPIDLTPKYLCREVYRSTKKHLGRPPTRHEFHEALDSRSAN